MKERNRFFRALNEIKEIAVLNCSEDLSEELKEQFKLITQKCDDALNSVTPTKK